MNVIEVVVVALWAILPAYVPNNAAVLGGGGRPIDGGRTWNGKRILGDGKTWRGTAAGILGGVATAVVLNALQPTVSASFDGSIPVFPVSVMLSLATGAMFGDILASFVKRRTGRNRGASFPGLDQLDFVVVALALTAVVNPSWFFGTFTLPVLVLILVVTPVLHVTTNVVAFRLGLKNEPW